MTKARSKTSPAMRGLEDLSGGSVSFAEMIRTLRECEELSLDAFAKQLGVSKAYLCDVEKGRRGVSVERAAVWASRLGYPEAQFVELALQASLDAAGLEYKVRLRGA